MLSMIFMVACISVPIASVAWLFSLLFVHPNNIYGFLLVWGFLYMNIFTVIFIVEVGFGEQNEQEKFLIELQKKIHLEEK